MTADQGGAPKLMEPAKTDWPHSIEDVLRAVSLIQSVLAGTAEHVGPMVRRWANAANLVGNAIQLTAERFEEIRALAAEVATLVAAQAKPAILLAQHLNERLRIVAEFTQTPEFQQWLDGLSSEQVQKKLESLLQETSDSTRSIASAGPLEEAQSILADRADAWLASTLAWLLNALRHVVNDPAERAAAFGLVLNLVIVIHGEISSGRDQAEILSEMRAQSASLSAQIGAADDNTRRLIEMTALLVAMQRAQNSYKVKVAVAPVRFDLAGGKSLDLYRGDEVQVLDAAGKWRRVQIVDADGQILVGWVLNKHLAKSDD